MQRTMNVPRWSERAAALANAPALAPIPAPYPNDGPSGGAAPTGSGQTLIRNEEEETLGQLRDRQMLASARASAPGRRAVFVHIECVLPSDCASNVLLYTSNFLSCFFGYPCPN